ncbi:MAG: sugar ABC transporter permease [Lachnospiraceae bacterium]|uniref:carbohydrate ABC transporter permease n=1 Tax=Oribacterium sp. P6A1 TaxID=1410612 RepID=UPI00055E7DEE|nr:sugar ABC transporter permease [Oribacterium sp. P6A1]MBE6003957.1 sugar ABC transporter permease [Lachnospiraceae bacterium]
MNRKKVKKSLYLYIAPGLFMVLAFVYVPIITNFIYSFFRLSSYSTSMKFVALDNYRRLFTNETFPIMIRNNIYYCIISLIVQVGFGTIIALVLENKLVGKMGSFYRSVYFIPSLISLTAVGLMFNFIYNPMAGMLNGFLKTIGRPDLQQIWLGDRNLAIFCIIAMSQWQYTGYIAMLMIVAFQNVSLDYVEAAIIDGAGPLRRALSVYIPLAKEQLLVCSIITIIGAFKLFTEVYTTTSGGPGNASQVLGLFLYQNAFLHDDMGMAASTGVLIFVITVTLSIIQLKLTKSGQD